MIYYLVWFFVALMAILGYSNKRYSKMAALMIILVVTLFCGLRFHDRWSDAEMYYSLFMNSGVADKDFEIGFKLLNKICRAILVNYNVYLCAMYGLVLSLYYQEYRDAIDIKYTPFCLFVFCSIMILSSGGFRQFIAGSILFFSIRYIRKRDLKKFLLLIVIAFLFHRTSICFVPMYWISQYKLKFISFFKIALVGVACGSIGLFDYIIRFVLEHMGSFSSVMVRVKLYMLTTEQLNLFSFGNIKRTLIILLFFIILKQKKEIIGGRNTLQVYLNIYAVGYLLSFFVPGTFSRINVYFYLAEPVIESLAIMNVKKSKYRCLLFLGLIILNLSIWTNTLLTFYPELMFPYKTCIFSWISGLKMMRYT